MISSCKLNPTLEVSAEIFKTFRYQIVCADFFMNSNKKY